MEKEKEKKNLLLFVPSAFLFLSLIGVVYFSVRNSSLKSERNRLLLKNDSLVSEKWSLNEKCDSLLSAINKLKILHDSEITHMYAEIESKSKKFNNDYSMSYYYKKQYNDLKADYDKTQKQLNELITENQELKSSKRVAETDFSELQRKYDLIIAKTDSAKKIKCYDFMLTNLTKSKKVTLKSRRIKTSKVSFKVAENLFAEPGSKTAYVVIYDPKGNILGLPQNMITLKDNKTKLNYSLAKTFDYTGKDMVLESEIKYTVKPVKGNYNVEIYLDGVCSGVSRFVFY